MKVLFSHVMDYKSQLQELIQRDGSGNIEYQILQEKGPAHNREFVSRVTLNNVALGLGSGKSKKEAEQQGCRRSVEKVKRTTIRNPPLNEGDSLCIE